MAFVGTYSNFARYDFVTVSSAAWLWWTKTYSSGFWLVRDKSVDLDKVVRICKFLESSKMTKIQLGDRESPGSFSAMALSKSSYKKKRLPLRALARRESTGESSPLGLVQRS